MPRQKPENSRQGAKNAKKIKTSMRPNAQ